MQNKLEYSCDSNGNQTHNHLVRKRKLNHLANLAKWLSCVESTYLYGAFDCMLESCHLRVSEWIHTLHSMICLNVKEHLARSRRDIWSLIESNKIRFLSNEIYLFLREGKF